jgi:replicative DNA helicase
VSVTGEASVRVAAAPEPVETQFDRAPPQDIAAEQSVLGGMLLSKDAIADVVEILRAGDFYRPAHATIFDAVLDLYGRGEPADPITVTAALTDAGTINRVGGMSYVHDLVHAVPTAANTAYYARIVAERAVLRRLVEAGTRIVQLGYGAASGAGRDTADVVDLAQQAVYDVTERRVSEDFQQLSDMLQPTLDEIEAIGARGAGMTGVPTGFSDLDALLHGLHPGQLIVVAGRPGLGKALALDTPLPTPDGWTTMGEVVVGDQLIAANGWPTTVVAVSDVMHARPCYEVEFSDGSVVVADGSHMWLTHTRRDRRYGRPAGVHTTEEILRTLRTQTGDRRRNHSVPNTRPLALPDRKLPIAPYTFGVWLGGGRCDGARFTAADPEIICYVEEEGLTGTIRGVGVLGDKHIPAPYLRASEAQRRALLAGLLDTDATVAPTGSVQYTTTSCRLADSVYELVVGLGYRCTINPKRVNGWKAESSTAYTLNFTTIDDVFRLAQKRLAHKRRRRADSTARTGSRYIVDVRPVESVPVKCVSVDDPDHLYLAGRSMIPTHNSAAALDFARHAAARHSLTSAIFSLEMSKVEIVMRLLAAEARVPLHVLRSGQLSDDDWTRLARRMGEISEAPLFIDDTPNMTLMEIRAKARRLRQRHDLRLLIVDYLQLMTSPRRVESRQQEVSELSRGLKLLAKEIDCPVVAVAQLNRGPEQRTDKRPQLSDLRECLTGDTLVTRADTGARVPIRDLVGQRDVPVWTVDVRLRIIAGVMSDVWSTGVKPVYRLTLASGRQVTATGNHPLLSVDGWKPVDALAAGDHVAVAGTVPTPPAAARKATDGSVTTDRTGRVRSHYVTTRRGLADGVPALRSVLNRVAGNPHVETIPAEAWDHARKAMREHGFSTRELARRLDLSCRGSTRHRAGLSRRRTARAAGAVTDVHLQDLAESHLRWDRIVSLEPGGEAEVFDAHVPGTHSFLANDVVSHNSGAIEQDSDVVILLHRDDYYDRESPRAGEADFIVAKHRNGPTDTVTVAAQLHFSRFVDMAVG